MLTLSGQPWEPVWTDFMGGQTRSPEWRATVNEMGEIPVLEGWLTVIGWLLRSPPFLPFFAPARMVPARGCVSGRPSNR
jgi:hypothetical protein